MLFYEFGFLSCTVVAVAVFCLQPCRMFHERHNVFLHQQCVHLEIIVQESLSVCILPVIPKHK